MTTKNASIRELSRRTGADRASIAKWLEAEGVQPDAAGRFDPAVAVPIINDRKRHRHKASAFDRAVSPEEYGRKIRKLNVYDELLEDVLFALEQPGKPHGRVKKLIADAEAKLDAIEEGAE